MIFSKTNDIEAAGKEQKETSAKEDIFAGQMLLHLYLHDGNYGYEIITFESTTKQKSYIWYICFHKSFSLYYVMFKRCSNKGKALDFDAWVYI